MKKEEDELFDSLLVQQNKLTMQKDDSTVHGGNNFFSSKGLNYTSLYSCFSPSSTSPSDSTTENITVEATPNFPKSNVRDQDCDSSPSPQSILIQEQQDIVNSHNICLAHLREARKEADALRLENTTLRVANRDLTNRLSQAIQESLEKRSIPSDYLTKQAPMLNEFRGLRINENRRNTENGNCSGDYNQRLVHSPTSVMDNQNDLISERHDNVERVSLPKSISVRSNGYLKNGPGIGNVNQCGGSRSLNLPRITSSLPNTAQRVYVKGGRQESGAVELEAYNQGMIKTELCNKWQETGACPYGDNCQFAHGMHELRPVIRHPRYKTEVCRMVLSGDPCPYGHRCHYRHALTDQEKQLIAAYNPRALNLNI